MVGNAVIMLHLPITKTWLLSRSAQWTFLASAILGLALLGVNIALAMLRGLVEPTQLDSSPLAQAIGLMFGIHGILGLAVLWVGMWYYCFRLDQARGVGHGVWFVSLYTFGPLVALIYYFSRYRHTVKELAPALSTEQTGEHASGIAGT
ncbi:MAG TPA: hypothetical protein VGQ71_14680 [Terriglobales bacterium]|nr:hypothetical protein [Terriglobales bacterium]